MTDPSPGKPGPTILFWMLLLPLVAAALLFMPVLACAVCELGREVNQQFRTSNPGQKSESPIPFSPAAAANAGTAASSSIVV